MVIEKSSWYKLFYLVVSEYFDLHNIHPLIDHVFAVDFYGSRKYSIDFMHWLDKYGKGKIVLDYQLQLWL